MKFQDHLDQLQELEAELLEHRDREDVRDMNIKVLDTVGNAFYDIETITVEGDEVVINVGDAI